MDIFQKKINVLSKIRTYLVDFVAKKNKCTGTFIRDIRVDFWPPSAFLWYCSVTSGYGISC